jgi:predicted metalloprotease
MIEDRRGQGGGFGGLGGGGFRIPMPSGKAGGIGGIGMLVLIVIALFASGVLGGGGSGSGPQLTGAPDPNDSTADFVGFVVEDVQTEWQRIFRADGRTYEVTKLVLYDGSTQSGCGLADASVGPFYCPADHKVYLDLGFFQELHDRFGAPGDFAQAYVIAHEFGHHVQTLMGTEARMREEARRHPDEANELSVRLELQADCYAGVWAHTAYEENLLESGDLQEGLDAAAAVGDDRIQRSAGQRINPESFTHGTSAQRVMWFKAGYADGDPGDCDTFSGSI